MSIPGIPFGDAEATANPPAPAPPTQPAAPAPTPAPQQPWWKAMLQGAINGLAGSRGATHFGAGAAGGAAGELQQEQLQKENAIQQQQQANANAETAANIKFRDLQSANAAAQLTRQDAEMHQLPEEWQHTKDQWALDTVDKMQRLFGIAYKPIPNTGQNAQQYLEQATGNDPNGAHVPSGIIMSPSTIYVPASDDENGPMKEYNFMKSVGPLFGLPVPSREQYLSAPPQQRRTMLEPIQNLAAGHGRNGQPLNAQQLDSQVAYLQNSLDAYKKSPNADPNVAGMGARTLELLKAQQAANLATEQRRFQENVATRTAYNESKPQKYTDDAGVERVTTAGNAIKNNLAVTGGAMQVGTLPDGRQVAGTPQELQQAGATGITKMPPAEQAKVVIARQMVAPNGLFSNVAEDLKQLEANGQLGIPATRWNDFVSGKVGTGPEFAKLRADMGLLGTALMQAHVGARGSDQMREHFTHLADYRISDAATLKAALSREFKYVTEKAAFAPKAGGQ